MHPRLGDPQRPCSSAVTPPKRFQPPRSSDLGGFFRSISVRRRSGTGGGMRAIRRRTGVLLASAQERVKHSLGKKQRYRTSARVGRPSSNSSRVGMDCADTVAVEDLNGDLQTRSTAYSRQRRARGEPDGRPSNSRCTWTYRKQPHRTSSSYVGPARSPFAESPRVPLRTARAGILLSTSLKKKGPGFPRPIESYAATSTLPLGLPFCLRCDSEGAVVKAGGVSATGGSFGASACCSRRNFALSSII